MIEEVRPGMRPCDRADVGCKAPGTIVAVTVTSTDYSENANPKDAIASLWLVCDEHLTFPLIEVKRLGAA